MSFAKDSLAIGIHVLVLLFDRRRKRANGPIVGILHIDPYSLLTAKKSIPVTVHAKSICILWNDPRNDMQRDHRGGLAAVFCRARDGESYRDAGIRPRLGRNRSRRGWRSFGDTVGLLKVVYLRI